MKKLVYFFLLIPFLFSCKNDSMHPGFSRKKSGIYMKLHQLGESNRKVKYGDYLTVDVSYATIYDSVFFEGRRKILLEKPVYPGAIESCFKLMREGEKASFIIKTADLFQKTLETTIPSFLDPDGNLIVNIDLIEIQSEKEFKDEKLAFLNWIEDFGDYEKVILQQYLDEGTLPVQADSGMFYLCLKEGLGETIKVGDTISINYEGKFLNGKYFDSTVKRKQAFQFVYGTEWQVIQGLERGLSMMREGEKSIFIFPSELAFGPKGSSTGIIPPFTSLIYEVEVLKVN